MLAKSSVQQQVAAPTLGTAGGEDRKNDLVNRALERLGPEFGQDQVLPVVP